MPKLKVPSESLKTKDRPVNADGSSRKRHLSKEHGSQALVVETKPKFNGYPQRNGFHDIYGQSDDESANEWEGYDITDLEIEETNEEESVEDEQMETNTTEEDPSSSLSTSSSDTPPSSPQSPAPNSSSRSNAAFRKRGVRCMECKACLRKEDCGKCVNCVDKPKFGGPGTRKQACVHRKCCNLLRNIPLKQPVKRTNDYYTLPVAKKSRTTADSDTANNDGNSNNNGSRLIVNPLRPRKVGTVRTKDDGVPTVQLHWPDSPSDYIGFPVYSITSDHINVCVRCGSGGHDGLMSCQICCQPFHWFCVGMSGHASSSSHFTCNRCVSCTVCGLPDECTQCMKCKLWFHQYCLLGHTSDHAPNGDQRFKCVQCTKCVSCKTDAPSKIEAGYGYLVSSLLASNPVWCDGFTYCNACYELKRKGNSCPVCGECYLDNDFDSKMMQCGRCDAWVHSHCDKMSNEDYEILSELPDTVEYMCTFCSSTDSNSEDLSWRTAIIEFKKESFDKLLDQLSKSLGNIWPNDTTPPADSLPTVKDFVSKLNQLLDKCGKTIRTGSKQHRLLYSTQQDYNKSIEDLFPWYSDVYSSEVDTPTIEDNKTTPIKVIEKTDCDNEHFMDTWPSLLLHDHCYNIKHKSITNNNINGDIINNKDDEEDSPTKDTRYCVLCSTRGDQPSMDAGRLIPCGSVDDWVHVNCAIWSAESYEDTAGLLLNVHSAISRGQRLRCDACKVLGATVGCCCTNCSSNYHYMCARKRNCIFLRNKEVYCQLHASLGTKDERVKDSEMRVDRCILVYTDLERPGRKMTRALDPTQLRLSLGSLCIQRLGDLTPLSDTMDNSILLPNSYTASCDFWSVTQPHKRTRYNLTVLANPQEDEQIHLPRVPPTKGMTPLAPDSIDWPCVDTEIGEEDSTNSGRGHWSSLSPITHIILTPSLLQAAYEFLKASECYPVPNGLKSFKIPKKTPIKTNSPKPNPTCTIDPLDSELERQYRQGLHKCVDMGGVCYEISTNDGSKWIDSDLKRLWSSVVGELQEARKKLDLPFIPLTVDNVMRQFGLTQPLVVQLIEQLPNIEKCSEHDFHFHKPEKISSWQSQRNIMNPTGCGRSEQYSGIRSTPDMFSFLMSDHRAPPPDTDQEALEIALLQAEFQGNNQRQGQSDLPVAMRYRNCQKTYKEYVNVFQSRIHGLGLFCTQEIDAGDMVIEYAGTVIRSILTDKREKYYESKDIGCYMFRIDCDDVVDATMSGNMARFINHSCEPNCYSKVVSVDNQKKIMIFALRKIVTGEELTYDYKFPIEDAKIPCKCGASKCRKTLN